MSPPRNFRNLPRERTPQYENHGNFAQRGPAFEGPAFSPRLASDLMSSRDIERALQEGIVPVADVVRLLRAYNTPPQLVQVGFPGLILAAGVANAIQITPKNPDRMSLLVCNPSPNSNITFSYDAPVSLGGVGLGNPVQTESSYPESNGSVSINAIYVWSDNATGTFPIPVIVYEGVLSIAGNKR